ncbi:MAG: acylneuraminate cytidylyltransferase family protein [Pseudomonadota bacterium]
MTGTRHLCLIPAKQGSTRFPKKNIARLGNRSLLQWTFDIARETDLFDTIALSTEGSEVAQHGHEIGIQYIIDRPRELARDPAGIVDVALHAVDHFKSQNSNFDVLTILAPCSPLRTAADIHAAFTLYEENPGYFVMSVSEFSHTPFAALELSNDQTLKPFFPEHFGKKSQEMPKAYRPNGAIHVVGIDRLRAEHSYVASPVIGYEMPQERAVDIDNPLDLAVAEALLLK